jgi:hypothetical protein
MVCSLVPCFLLIYVPFWSPNTLFTFLLAGKWLGNRQIRCNWATKGASAGEEKQIVDSKADLTNGTSGKYMCFDLSFSFSLCFKKR